jgi:hypothetical protein
MPAEQSQALIRFLPGWERDGVSEDGLPRYRAVVRIIKEVPPLTKVEYLATDQDFEDNPGPYALYLKEQDAANMEPREDGFPLALWPAVSPSQFQALAHRDINTVEQLAKWADRRGDTSMPGEFKELAQRAKTMIDLTSQIGKFEEMLRDLRDQRDALVEQTTEQRATISAQNSMIASLRGQKAA